MRCKNCGWENPDTNSKCEKCNTSLTGATAGTKYDTGTSSSNFDAKKTAQGCPECGYPMMAGAAVCPNCNHKFSQIDDEIKKEPDNQKKKEFYKRTVMNSGPRNNETNAINRKVVGFLVTYSWNFNGEFYPLFEGRNNIGRDGSVAEICINEDEQISGKHFSILYRAVDNKFKFRDEQSSNGTFVNDELIDEGELKNHDVILVGSTKLIFIVIPQLPKSL